MVGNPYLPEQFEDDLIRKSKPDFRRNPLIVGARHRETVTLGALPAKDRLAGIEVIARVAKTVNDGPTAAEPTDGRTSDTASAGSVDVSVVERPIVH